MSEGRRPRSELSPEERIAQDLEWHRKEIDPRDNEETTPPAEESIETGCVWVAECYSPSHASALVSGIKDLGWDRRRPTDLYGDEPLAWLERQRGHPYGGAWLNLGTVVKEGEEGRFIGSDCRVSELPAGVDFAFARVRNVLPSLTVLTMQFVLEDALAESLEKMVRRTYETYFETRGDIQHFATVSNQKMETVRRTRAELRARCCRWFREHLPGLFSSEGEGTYFPTCEFVVFDAARPFERPRSGGRIDYLWPLRMDHGMDAWEGPDLTGVRLGLPSPFDEEQMALTLAAKRDDLPSQEDLRGYGGRSRFGLANWLEGYVEGLMTVWSLHAMLRVYERRLATVRDGVGQLDVQEPEIAARNIQSAQARLIRTSTDLLPLTSELEDLCEEEQSFSRLTPKFESLIEYPWGRLNLSEVRREDLLRRTKRTREFDGELREVVMTGGSVVGTISQERSTRANLRLQGRLTFLTWVLVVLTVVLVVIGIVTVWVAA